MADGTNGAQIPSRAIDGGTDLVAPVAEVLHKLYLLGTKDEMDAAGVGATLGGPPQSVAVIEAGATALSKWWAAGGSVTLAGIWTWAGANWPKDQATQQTAIWGLAILSAALVLTIGHLLASDVRSRAMAATATIAARAAIADSVIRASSSASSHRVTVLTHPFPVSNLHLAGSDEAGWTATAAQVSPEGEMLRYLIQKDGRAEWVNQDKIFLGH